MGYNGQQQQGGGFNNRLADYVEVNVRVQQFYERFPEGSIQTEILKWENETIVMKAYAYRTADDVRPATGHAYEKEGSSQVNRTSALENAETSAVGRALALLGFSVKKSIASRDEVENAVHQQQQPEKKPTVQQGKATPAQKKAIAAACKQAGMDSEKCFEFMDMTLGHHDVDAMTAAECSKLITALPEYMKGDLQ